MANLLQSQKKVHLQVKGSLHPSGHIGNIFFKLVQGELITFEMDNTKNYVEVAKDIEEQE